MRRFTRELLAATLLAAAGMALAQPPAAEKPAAPPGKDQSLEKMTLAEMLGLALKNNPDIRVAEAKLREAEAELNRTRLGVTQKVIALQAGLEAARKTAVDAEQRLKRIEQLVESRSVRAEEKERAALALAQAKAELAKLEAEVPYLLGKAQALDILRGFDLGGEVPRESRVQPGGIDLGAPAVRSTPLPASVAAKLRETLEMPVKFSGNEQAQFADILNYLEERHPALNFRNTMRDRGKQSSPTFTLKSKEPLPVRAVLQMLEDEYPGDGVRFVVREYGILVVDGPTAVPPGGLLVGEFLRGDAPDHGGMAVRKNPPAAKVDGTVKQVDAATGLVTISIGSDAGLEKGHTLEVYRLSPARYIGTLTVVEVQPTTAVGRVKAGKDAVQVGDRIANKLLGD